MATMVTTSIGTGIVDTRIASVGTGSSGKRARGKRAKAAQSASVSSSVPVVSPFVESCVGGVKNASLPAVEESPSGTMEAIGGSPCDLLSFAKSCDSEVSGVSRVQKLPASGSSSELSAQLMASGGKVQNFTASLIPSELSAHQMPPSGVAPHWRSRPTHQLTSAVPSLAPLIPPLLDDALILYWTLVDQHVIPPGHEEAFKGFASAWIEAAERDDERKAHWSNVSAAVALAAQRKVREDKARLEAHSRDQFLLAAIQKPTSFRTKFQRVLYEGATARKDAKEDERSRWLHILARVVLNTDTPMAKMLREKPGNAQLLGAGKRASALRARVATPCGSRLHTESPYRLRQLTL